MNTKRRTRSIHKLSPVNVMKLDKGKYGDGGGLWLMKDSRSTGRWAYRYQHHGKSHELGLGGIHTFSLSEARDKAKALRKLVKDGTDPLEDRRATTARKRIEAAAAITFQDYAEEYVKNHRAGWSNLKHAQQWTQSLKTYAFPIIGGLPIGAVDTEAVKRVLLQTVNGTTFWTAKPETASRVRSRIEKILGAAKISGKCTFGDNPAKWGGYLEHVFVPRSKAEKGRKSHHPALPFAEVPVFMEALRARDGIAARALEFVVLTAARVSEVRLATWDEIDLLNKMWTVPAHKMKAREEHRVPLSDRAVEILKLVKGEGDHVFPGRGAPISDKSIREVLTGIRSGFTVHGFRSSFKDWAAEATEYPREVSEMALAHRVGSEVEQAYRRTRLFDRRRSIMNDWAAFCGGKTASVLDLKFAHVG